MKVILANGVELNPIIITGSSRKVHGATRDVLTFVFDENTTLESLETTFTESNCETITIVEGENAKYIHKGYVILSELAKRPMEIVPATEEAEGVYENRAFIGMAQRTYAENQIAENTAALNALLTGGDGNV